MTEDPAQQISLRCVVSESALIVAPAVSQALIDAAIARAPSAWPSHGPPTLVIKAVAEKQRPRRPS